MLKEDLANELRQRQHQLGEVSRELIDALNDDEIIDSYITCSCCGKKQVEANQLSQAIANANNVVEFFAICDTVARLSSHLS